MWTQLTRNKNKILEEQKELETRFNSTIKDYMKFLVRQEDAETLSAEIENHTDLVNGELFTYIMEGWYVKLKKAQKPGENLAETALHYSKQSFFIQSIKYLLAANIDENFNNSAAFLAAARIGNLEIFRMLNKPHISKEIKEKALLQAAENGNSDILCVLLAENISPNILNGKALFEAAHNGWWDTVEILLQAGGNFSYLPNARILLHAIDAKKEDIGYKIIDAWLARGIEQLLLEFDSICILDPLPRSRKAAEMIKEVLIERHPKNRENQKLTFCRGANTKHNSKPIYSDFFHTPLTEWRLLGIIFSYLEKLTPEEKCCVKKIETRLASPY